jgi:hypothetical protein
MILSFRDKRRRAFFEGERVKAFQSIERQAMMRLERLHAADRLMALNTPGNRNWSESTSKSFVRYRYLRQRSLFSSNSINSEISHPAAPAEIRDEKGTLKNLRSFF